MPTLLPALLTACLLRAARGSDRAPDTVAYTLAPVLDSGQLTGLAVEVRLRADASGVTRLRLPDRWAGESEFWRGVRDLRVDGGAVAAGDDSAERVIRSRPGAPLVVRYRVVSDAPRELSLARRETQPFRLHLTGSWFYGTGEQVFARPAGRDSVPARFDWTGAPVGFAFASDLEHLAGAHRAATRPGVVVDAMNSVLLGGRDVRVVTRPSDPAAPGHTAPVRVAVRGTFPFADTALAGLVAATLAEERRFWGDHASPFLVTLGPVESAPGAVALSGAGRGDAFELSVSPSVPLADLRDLLEHELFHTWNPGQLGGLPNDGADAGRLGYWFSEGFTDFYARRLLVRSGRLSPQEWAAGWNQTLAAYAASPVRTAPNARVAADFWKDGAVQMLPYERGALLAAIWDARLRQQSGGRRSLDTVLREQRRLARAGGRTPPGAAPRLFQDVAARMGLDVSADVRRFVDAGEPILLPADVFGPCAVVETQRVAAFDRGWDAEATAKAHAIAGLREDSPAYAAGLRDGMVPVRPEAGTVGDSRVAYALRVKDGDRERVIRFLPQGREEITLQTVRLTDGAKGCADPRYEG